MTKNLVDWICWKISFQDTIIVHGLFLKTMLNDSMRSCQLNQ